MNVSQTRELKCNLLRRLQNAIVKLEAMPADDLSNFHDAFLTTITIATITVTDKIDELYLELQSRKTED
jgi:hypothetical protein